MELITKLIVNPMLWIVYSTLPLLNGPLDSPPSFSFVICNWDNLQDPLNWGVVLGLVIFAPILAFSVYAEGKIFTYLEQSNHSWPLAVLLWIIATLFLPTIVYQKAAALNIARYICLVVIVECLYCLYYFLHLSIFIVLKATTLFFIVGLKNRKACQFLSTLSALVIGFTKAKVFAAIPAFFLLFLTIPDFDPDPWVKFRLRFAEFLTANMDEESLNALLYSKFFKMLSCNEMMPSLGPLPSNLGAWFVRDEGTSSQHENFDVQPEYRIGLGSITTLVRQDQIDVQVFTPFSGVKNRTVKNTPRSRYNLDKSARFWSENPEMGIWNRDNLLVMHPDEMKSQCMSTDEWIKFCGLDDYIFEDKAVLIS